MQPSPSHRPRQRQSREERSIRVCLSPALIPYFKLTDAVVVVIDVLRATTSMCVAFDKGAAEIVPVETIEECAPYIAQGYLAAAERNGETVPGFAMGNSPYAFMGDNIRGARIVVTTTNGTHAIRGAERAGAAEIVVGSFANLNRVAEHLRQSPLQHAVMLCAGWKNNVNLEDTLYAGALVDALQHDFRLGDDAATTAWTLYQAAQKDMRYYLRNSSHTQRLLDLGLERDVKYCLHQDTHPVLPVFHNGRLVL